jgi:predicted neutral ceramidase superfamily lipid hydrolase
MRRNARNVAIIALIALAIVLVPGGGTAAALVVAVISLAFLAAIAWCGARLYRENSFTLSSLSTAHRVLLYGAITAAFMVMVATPRLWESGIGTICWLALLAGAGFAVYYVWSESRRYRV